MKNESRQNWNAYLSRIAQLNGVGAQDTVHAFNVAPSIQQKLETAMQESSEFLKKINIIGVTEQQGAKLGLSLSGPAASRTNTAERDRQTRDLTKLASKGYHCLETHYDTHLTYAKIDLWAKFKDFQTRVANLYAQQQALDRICVGFNGTSRAADTNIETNPLLQDVNKGWLQKMRENAPQNVMATGEKQDGKVLIGAGGDYLNLDAAVVDACQLLEPWFLNHPDLVVILGRQLMHDKYFPLVNSEQKPTETLAADVVISQKRVGGLPAVAVPFFPDNALMITTFDNLSIYWQEGARRRHIQENPKRSRIEDYQSSNDDYVVEDEGKAVVVENIEFKVA